MKSIKISLLSMLIVFVFAFSANSQNLGKIKAEIEKINNELNEAVVAGDMNKGLEYYDDDVISMPNWSPMMRGIDAVKKENQAMMEQGMKFNSFNTETLEVFGAGNMIIEIGKYNLQLTMPGMQQSINDYGNYLTVWEKGKDGSLKIRIETWNTNQNPMQLMSGRGGKQAPELDIMKDDKGKAPKKDTKSERR
ncbi:MAG: DUF4440 domain-containing protein [Bacteroidales bacterium]|nr:DUF4440 domain-containing protein [Bacteroidales bacterium]MCF8398899.1 DUF4440 domain-containing protein [Bacteroidales bacterium]